MSKKPMYTSVEEVESKIEQYFLSLEAVKKDEFGNALTDVNGEPITFMIKPPTVTGLALALGFTSRQALLNYQAKKSFVDTITRAKSLVEEYTEGRLFDRDGVNGAKFSLINNFRGWRDKPQDDNSNVGELAQLIKALKDE